jgi:hypothetical protein
MTGCINTSALYSNTDSITYESTLSSQSIGYIDYQSSDLLNNIPSPVIVNISYTGKNAPFDKKDVQITNVIPENGRVRIYIPALEDERFEQMDLIVNFGTVRVTGVSFNGPTPEWKRLNRGLPTEITRQAKKITITSEITTPGTYSATLLKRIKK